MYELIQMVQRIPTPELLLAVMLICLGYLGGMVIAAISIRWIVSAISRGWYEGKR